MKIRPDILEHATHLFGRYGYERASMEDIAELVGIKKQSLYHYVSTKEDLLFAIHDQLIRRLLDGTRDAILSLPEGATDADTLRAVLRVAMGFIATEGMAVTIFLRDRQVFDSERWLTIRKSRDEYEALVRSILQSGAKAGSLVSVEENLAVKGLLGMVFWGYTWFRSEGKYTADQVAELFGDMLLNGLAPRGQEAGHGA